MEIVEVFKLIGEGALWLVTLWFAKGWVEAKILEPLKELKDDVKDVKKNSAESQRKMDTAAFNVTARTQELQQMVSQETQKMTNIFSQAAHEANVAHIKAGQALERANVVATETDQKLRNVGANLLGKIKVIEADVAKVKSDTQEIRKDVFYIKGKKE